jgi:hypothetical protein
MKKILISFLGLSIFLGATAQNSGDQPTKPDISDLSISTTNSIEGILLPILFIGFLLFMLVSIVKYFLAFRLKNKMIDRGMTEQIAAELLNKNEHNKLDDIIKIAILFCGLGIGLLITHFSSPLGIHSLAIMAFSIGLSYFAYFFYLQKQKK